MAESLMRGDNWVRCCICFELHSPPFTFLAVDPTDGLRWDVCVGQCAKEAGLPDG